MFMGTLESVDPSCSTSCRPSACETAIAVCTIGLSFGVCPAGRTPTSSAETLTALEDLGYPADEAQRKMDVVEARRVAAATNTVIGDLHTEYKKGHLSDAAVLAALEALGLSADGAQRIVAAWAAYLTAAGIAPAA